MMIIARTNCHIRPIVNAITLVVNACRPVGDPDANAGATTQPRMAIGTAAAAQMASILPKLYCGIGETLCSCCMVYSSMKFNMRSPLPFLRLGLSLVDLSSYSDDAMCRTPSRAAPAGAVGQSDSDLRERCAGP